MKFPARSDHGKYRNATAGLSSPQNPLWGTKLPQEGHIYIGASPARFSGRKFTVEKGRMPFFNPTLRISQAKLAILPQRKISGMDFIYACPPLV